MRSNNTGLSIGVVISRYAEQRMNDSVSRVILIVVISGVLKCPSTMLSA